jgi:hypothetical protein
MRSLIIASFAALLMVSAAVIAKTKNADFSGAWNLNQEKSVLGEGGQRRLATALVVEQKGNGLTVTRKGKSQSGEDFETVEKFTLDGKECVNTVRERPRTSTAVWSADGQGLTIATTSTFERNGDTTTVKSTETWKLGEKNAVLSIDFNSQSPRGERKGTYVYDKAVAGK